MIPVDEPIIFCEPYNSVDLPFNGGQGFQKGNKQSLIDQTLAVLVVNRNHFLVDFC